MVESLRVREDVLLRAGLPLSGGLRVWVYFRLRRYLKVVSSALVALLLLLVMLAGLRRGEPLLLDL